MGTEAVAGPTSPPRLQPRLVQHSGAGPNPASGGTPCLSVLLISVVVVVIGCVCPAPRLSLVDKCGVGDWLCLSCPLSLTLFGECGGVGDWLCLSCPTVSFVDECGGVGEWL